MRESERHGVEISQLHIGRRARMHRSIAHRRNGMATTEGEGCNFQLRSRDVLESVVEVPEAGLVRANWKGSELRSVVEQCRPIRLCDAPRWRSVPSRVRLLFILRQQHELEGASLHYAKRVPKSNR